VYFLAAHPKARALLGLEGPAPAWVTPVFVAAWALPLAAMIAAWASTKEGRSGPKLAYAALTLMLHGFAYFFVARFEPVYSASTGPDEDFLLLSIVLTVFHNVQYVALVWIHNRSRFGGASAGPATWASASAARFLGACLAFSVLYYAAASMTGVFPIIRSFVGAKIGDVSVNKLGLAIWWGLALHHYVLDQRIWRIKDDPDLRGHLGVEATRRDARRE
jgi:hypothetical protein